MSDKMPGQPYCSTEPAGVRGNGMKPEGFLSWYQWWAVETGLNGLEGSQGPKQEQSLLLVVGICGLLLALFPHWVFCIVFFYYYYYCYYYYYYCYYYYYYYFRVLHADRHGLGRAVEQEAGLVLSWVCGCSQ